MGCRFVDGQSSRPLHDRSSVLSAGKSSYLFSCLTVKWWALLIALNFHGSDLLTVGSGSVESTIWRSLRLGSVASGFRV